MGQTNLAAEDKRSSNWIARLVLWIATLFSPSVFTTYYNYSGLNLIAPTWCYSQYFTNSGTHTFFFFLIFYPYGLDFIFGFMNLISFLFYSSPLIIAAIAVELFARGIGRRRLTLLSVIFYPLFVLVFGIFLMTLPYPAPIIPIPLASLVQYIRYKQLQPQYKRLHKARLVASLRSEGITESFAPKLPTKELVEALRGGEFVGNKMRYKVKVVNNSDLVVTDVMVAVISYPRDTLKLDGDDSKSIAKLEPRGFRSPTFNFLPTQDCVKGDIVASVSFVDSTGKAHSITTEPFTIRAVCDLLRPETISPEEFMPKLASLDHGEMAVRVEEWTPEEMHSKALQILESSNFSEVSSEINPVGDHVESKISGWARGKYTDKSLGVQITITGRRGTKGATCKVRMSGEDEAMIMPAIDEIAQKLSAWLCPMCGGKLSPEAIDDLKAGKSVPCPFCGVTVER